MKPLKGKLGCRKCSANKGCNKNKYKLQSQFRKGHETHKDFRHKLKDYEK